MSIDKAILIRAIGENDYSHLMNVAREAFWNLYCPGAQEHLIVHQLLSDSTWAQEASFVIEVDNEIVGAIFYSKTKVQRADGSSYETLLLGPLYILPTYHRQGLGRQLVEHSLKVVQQLGYPIVFVMGYDYHYAPYGFVGAKKYGVSLEDGVYYQGVMALCFSDEKLNFAGQLIVPLVYHVDEVELKQFDLQFPPKEPLVLPSQAQFEQAVVAVDTQEY